MNQVICAVLKKFQISHQERAAFTYLGLQMKQLPNAIRVQQSSYVGDISPIVIEKGRNKFDKLTDDESHQLRALARQLNWVAKQTRPDVAFDAPQASIAATNGTVNDLQAANKALKNFFLKKWCLISKTLAILRKLEFLHLVMHPMLILKGGHPKVDILYFYMVRTTMLHQYHGGQIK